MKTMTSRSVKAASRKIGKAKNLNHEVVRKAIEDALRHGNLNGEFKFLTFAGLLPVFLPDGTKIAVLPDIHVPAHDKKVMWAVLRALKDFQPDIVILIGDVADCFAISAWPADPSVKRDFQNELDETRELMDEIREVSGCYWMFFIMGNHEDRMWRLLTNVAPSLANVLNPKTRERAMSIHDLLGYGPEDNVTFLYDLAERGGFGGGIVANGGYEWHHGYIVRPAPGASPRADADKTGRSTHHGHTHRKGMVVRETTTGEIVAVEGGHLIEEGHPYIAYSNLLNNHHQGFDLCKVINGKIHTQPVPVVEFNIDGKLTKGFIVGDKTYLAADR